MDMLPNQYVQSPMTFLNFLQHVRIIFGENELIMDNESMQNTEGLQFMATDGAKTIKDVEILGELGLSRAIGNAQSYSTALPSNYFRTGSVVDENVDYFQMAMSPFNRRVDQPIIPTNGAFSRRLNIPMSALHPFFARENTFLPPGMPIKVHITYQKSFFERYNKPASSGYRTMLGFTGGLDIDGSDYALNSLSEPKFLYQYNTLKEMSNDLFVKQFGMRPLIYNYYTYGKSELQMNSNEHVDHVFLEQKALPLEIFIAVVLRNDVNNNGLFNETLTDQFPIFNGNNINLLNSPAGAVFKNIRIVANGVQIKEMLGNTYGGKINKVQYFGKSSDEIISDIGHAQNTYENPRQIIFNNSAMDNRFSSAPVKIILSPGDIYNIHKYPIDKGPTNLRITFDVVDVNGDPFDSKYSAVVYYKMPSQLLINNRFTCMQVKWPAISNGSYQFITPTIGAN